jgi:Putative MetA-pathway of phenol degradation
MRTFARKTGSVALAGFLATMASGFLPVHAELPFLTDEAETLGKGTRQVELWYLGSTDKGRADGSVVKTDSHLPGATFGYGVAEQLDLTLGFARRWGKATVDDSSPDYSDSAVSTLSAKWQFHEYTGFHFAVKPLVGYSYRLGGTREEYAVTYGGWLMVTREHEALEVSLNAGFLYNDYGSAAERDATRSGIWNISALAEYKALPKLKLGLDVGAYTNPDKRSGEMPVYALAGVVFSPTGDVDLSVGFKYGVNRPEPDLAGTAGITFRF